MNEPNRWEIVFEPHGTTGSTEQLLERADTLERQFQQFETTFRASIAKIREIVKRSAKKARNNESQKSDAKKTKKQTELLQPTQLSTEFSVMRPSPKKHDKRTHTKSDGKSTNKNDQLKTSKTKSNATKQHIPSKYKSAKNLGHAAEKGKICQIQNGKTPSVSIQNGKTPSVSIQNGKTPSVSNVLNEAKKVPSHFGNKMIPSQTISAKKSIRTVADISGETPKLTPAKRVKCAETPQTPNVHKSSEKATNEHETTEVLNMNNSSNSERDNNPVDEIDPCLELEIKREVQGTFETSQTDDARLVSLLAPGSVAHNAQKILRALMDQKKIIHIDANPDGSKEILFDEYDCILIDE